MKLFHLLLALLLAAVLPASAARPIISGEDLMRHGGQFYPAADMAFPEAYGDVERWRQGRAAVSGVSQFGGAYWLVAQVRNDSEVAHWVVAPGSVLFERAAIRVYAAMAACSRWPAATGPITSMRCITASACASRRAPAPPSSRASTVRFTRRRRHCAC